MIHRTRFIHPSIRKILQNIPLVNTIRSITLFNEGPTAGAHTLSAAVAPLYKQREGPHSLNPPCTLEALYHLIFCVFFFPLKTRKPKTRLPHHPPLSVLRELCFISAKMNISSPPPATATPRLSLTDQQHLVDKLEVFKIQGRDKHGRKVLRIVGKFFPGNYN